MASMNRRRDLLELDRVPGRVAEERLTGCSDRHGIGDVDTPRTQLGDSRFEVADPDREVLAEVVGYGLVDEVHLLRTYVEPGATEGEGRPVLAHLEAEDIAVEGDSLAYVANIDRNMMEPQRLHSGSMPQCGREVPVRHRRHRARSGSARRGDEMARFAVVGSGWRSEFFVRIADALPDRFDLAGVVTRDAARGHELQDRWHTRAFSSLDEMSESVRPDFVVVSVPSTAAVGYLRQCAAKGLPALCETPPAHDLGGLLEVTGLARSGARLQVAEQYPFQPLHAARLALTDAGAIGEVSMASVSFSHGYHAFSVMRRHLGVTGEVARIRASVLRSEVETGGTRAGPRTEVTTTEEVRTVALVEVGGKLGVYDFGENQHRSYVRLQRVDVRGSRGEIAEDQVRLVRGLDESVTISLRREMGGQEGDLTGHYLKGISGPDGWIWRNPFPGARLADDEIAIARCMDLMASYADGGPPFYGVADAAQDHYLYLALQEAAATGETIVTSVQPWADAMLHAGA